MRRIRSGKKGFIAFVAGLMVVIVLLAYTMLRTYSARIDRQLFNASSTNLEDTYAEAVLVFDELTTSRWNYLRQMALYMNAVDAGNTDEERLAQELVNELREPYGFTEFYFLNESGQYITVTGDTGYIDLGNGLFDLIDDGKDIVTDGSLPGRENMFFYAVPADAHTYKGFSYCAVAFGYDKQDISGAMELTAYHGESDSYLVYPNGRVCITMGDVRYESRNVLSTMEETGVDEATIEQVRQGLQDGTTDTVTIERDGVTYYFSYQSTGLSDWRLVSLTPTSVVDRDMNIVRSTTSSMMLGLGTMLMILIAAVAVYWGWRSMRDMNSMLAERELIFLTMSEHMDEIYILYNDEEQRARYVSPNVERLIGVTPQAIYEDEAALTACIVEKDRWNNRTELHALPAGEMLHREYQVTNQRTGETRPFVMDIFRSDNPAHPHSLVISMADNTREIAIRNEITAAMESARAANEAKTSFLSSMSHDIRTPMNAIIGFTTLLDRDAADPTQVHYYTDKIRTSGNHLLGLINDVLDISKIEAGNVTLQPEELRIREITDTVQDFIRSQVDARGQELTVRVDVPQDEVVMADRLRLTQILQNLLSNAVKYTQDGGHIAFEVTKDKDKDKDKDKGIFVTYHFVVRDDGIGMSEEFQEQIFQPFTREISSTVNRIQGTGLGMSITKSLVDLMGGAIQVTSRLNQGSTFTVDIPFRLVDSKAAANAAGAAAGAAGTASTGVTATGVAGQASATGAEAQSAQKAYSIEGFRILAAEDNEINAEILSELLDMEGVTCTLAGNGQEAVTTYESAGPGQFDLILMDVQMPIMDGYAATRAIRASTVNPEGAEIPIIAMTANAFSEDVQNALAAGMNAHLSKPVNMDALRQTAGRLVEEYRENH